MVAATPSQDTSQNNGRVIGGQATTIESFPYNAFLLTAIYSPLCGAVVITEQHILTAAHCVQG